MKLKGLLFILITMGLGGCASLKPVAESKVEIPAELPPEIQNKFKVSDVLVEDSKKIEPIKKPVKNPISKTKAKTVTTDELPVKEKTAIEPWIFNPTEGSVKVYAVYAPLGIRAGTLEVKVVGKKYLQNNPVWHLKANIYNAAFFASIFKVNLLVESYVDPVLFRSLRYQVTGQEGKLNKQVLELYDYDKNQFIDYKNSSEDQGGKSQIYPGLEVDEAQDVLSSFFKIETLDFKSKSEYTFFVVNGNKVKTAKVVKIKEMVFKNHPVVVVGLSMDGHPEASKQQIFIDLKTNQIVQILADMKWGKFKVELEGYE